MVAPGHPLAGRRRIVAVQQALRAGAGVAEVHERTGIDPWFLDQICLINEIADEVRAAAGLDIAILRRAKRHGFSDRQIAQLRDLTAKLRKPPPSC